VLYLLVARPALEAAAVRRGLFDVGS